MSVKGKPIGSVSPREGIPYLAGYEAAGNNPALFAEFSADRAPIFIVASPQLVKEFSGDNFEKAVAHYKNILRQNDYKPGDSTQLLPVDSHPPSSADARKSISDIPIGAAICFLAGYRGNHSNPTIYARGGDDGELVVVDQSHYEAYSLKNFPTAVQRFKALVDARSRGEISSVKRDRQKLSVIWALSISALILVMLVYFGAFN